jgi:uncharacterized protein
LFHSPPNNTDLDQLYSGLHVGSIAIREFIEINQPYLTLHGHIHETVEVSGRFIQKLGNTICISSGNHEGNEKLAVIVFELEKPIEAKRILC